MTSDDARASVQRWLDGDGSAFARRVHVGRDSQRMVWTVDLDGQHGPVTKFQISLPRGFPADPCEVFVDKRLCLKLPHVEEDGRVCLGVGAPPRAYEDGAWAVTYVLERFMRDFLERVTDPAWVESELQAERLSYWARHCDKLENRSVTPRQTWLALPDDEAFEQSSWQAGAIAAYVRPRSLAQRIFLQLITSADTDPNEVAQRHKWASGGLLRGEALLVKLPTNHQWTPSTWPTTFGELRGLVADCTGGEILLEKWLGEHRFRTAGPKRVKQQVTWRRSGWSEVAPGFDPRVVVLLDGSTPYAFHLGPPPTPIASPIVTPLKVNRVDRRWALGRDHDTPMLDGRRGMKVLLVGCGSLGSPVAEMLARAGIGHLDLVDAERMETPNVSRHVLGLSSIGENKAIAMAERLRQLVPACEVRGFEARVGDWIAHRPLDVQYDVVLDCTGESSVRTLLSTVKASMFGQSRVLHAWVEPFCAAAHMVATTWAQPWPVDDPADSHVNAADFGPDGGRVALPACGAGFHPYGASDVVQAAAFVAERALSVMDGSSPSAMVYSWVRSKAFFDALPVRASLRPIVPVGGGRFSSEMVERTLESVLL